jgi:hypothetical protein
VSTTPVSFWGGSTVHGGRVKRLTATTFKQLVDHYINVPVQHPLTRREFFAQTVDDQNKSKDGAFICACTFAYDQEGRRSDENATHSVLVILDLDEGEFVKDFSEDPDSLATHLYPYNFAAWRTAKHTTEAPRLKVMVEVAPCHPENHRRLVAFIASRLGLPRDFKGVIESRTVSQPQYRPLAFRGDNSFPVIASNTSGIPVHLSDLPEVEEEDDFVEGRTYACDPDHSDEFFGLAFLPIQGITVEDVREPLFAIDPDTTYKPWLEVFAALKHQFTEEDEARQAYDMAVEWSSQGTKFKGRRDCYAKWKSLKPFAKGRAPVTLRTLFHYAQEAGWQNAKVAAKISQSFNEWLEATTDKQTLIQEGAQRIAAMPFGNLVEEEEHLKMWRKRLATVIGEPVDKSVLKKQLDKTRREDKKAKAEAAGPQQTPPWLTPIVYVSTSDTFHNIGNTVELRPAAFDRTYAKELMPKDGELPPNGVPVMQPSAYALNILQILRVDEALYNPTHAEEEKVYQCKATGKIYLNTYDFNSVPVADPEHKGRAEKLIRQLVNYLLKEPELRELLLDYLALQCQFPGRKIPWSFMIQSGPGAGKGTLSEVMQAVMGKRNVKLISPSMMASAFNEWAIGSALGVFNEVHIPGERRDQVMNAIKPLITDPTLAISLKHRDGQCHVDNYCNYIAFTNDKAAAHLSGEDRRWCIAFSPVQTKEQAMALVTSGHFDEVRWLCTSEGASALRYYFLKRVISPDFPLTGHAPDTKYRAEVVEQSKNSLQIAIEDAISDEADPLVGPEVIHEGRLREIVCRTARDPSLVPRYLSLMGYERESAKRVMVDGSRGAIWVRTESWKGGDTVEYLKARMRGMPELDDPVFE